MAKRTLDETLLNCEITENKISKPWFAFQAQCYIFSNQEEDLIQLRKVSKTLRNEYPDPVDVLNCILKPILEKSGVKYDKFMKAVRDSDGYLLSFSSLIKIICAGYKDYPVVTLCLPYPDIYSESLLKSRSVPPYLFDKYGLDDRFNAECQIDQGPMKNGALITIEYRFKQKNPEQGNTEIAMILVSTPSLSNCKTVEERKYTMIEKYSKFVGHEAGIIAFDGKQLLVKNGAQLCKKMVDLVVDVCRKCTRTEHMLEAKYRVVKKLEESGFKSTISMEFRDTCYFCR